MRQVVVSGALTMNDASRSFFEIEEVRVTVAKRSLAGKRWLASAASDSGCGVEADGHLGNNPMLYNSVITQ